MSPRKKTDATTANQAVEGDDYTQDDAMEEAFVAGTLPEEDRRAPLTPIPEEPYKEVGLHALDTAPVNSKIVVVYEEGKTHVALLSTPDEMTRLAKDDPAQRLPIGAKIVKKGEHYFVAEQISPSLDRDLLVTETAADAIQRFVHHFHE